MALTFELSKVETVAIRERMISHLINIVDTLASEAAHRLGMKSLPKFAPTSVSTRQGLDPSPALGIVERGPKRFEARKLGILVADGVDAKLLKVLTSAVMKEKGSVKLTAPTVGGAIHPTKASSRRTI